MKTPYYWLNAKSRKFLANGYLREGQTAEERIKEIAERAEELLDKPGFADKFIDYMSRGWYSLASPVWSNFGAGRGLPISCNGSLIQDTMTSILEKTAEVGMMTKNGAGTSAYFGKLRERGATISTGGTSSGPVHFMEMFDTITNVVSQSNVRRGSFAAYLPVDHPDIMEFLEIREDGHTIQNMSLGVCISDSWMESMVEGDKDKRKIWSRIIKKRFESGYPYLFFTDTANKCAPQWYKEQGKKVYSSNLCCVSGDQRVVTDCGLLTAKELYEQGGELTVFDGERAVPASAMQLIGRADVYKITLENGLTHTITACHKVMTRDGLKRCDELTIKDKIQVCILYEFTTPTNESFIEPIKVGDFLYYKHKNPTKYSEVVSIEYVGKEDVYCCEVYTDEHLWVVNGIVTHNSEISLSLEPDESFVCCLSSMNLVHYDEWKDTDAVETLLYFLDAIMSEYIEKVKDIPFMRAAYNFAVSQRAVGLGVLGWHSLLQSKMVPFESMEAKLLNVEIFKLIQEKCDKANQEMAELYGEPSLLSGYKRRMAKTMAVAPTVSSSFILGQISPSIEPLNSNYFVKDLAKGTFTFKNPQLKKVLSKHDKDDKETWQSILKKGGSVQHLKFLTDNEKDVFKTFGEISQMEVVIQAAQRQKYIDQSQSLNIMVPPKVSPKEVSQLLIEGWRLGVKSFYYQRGANPAQELSRDILSCNSCEG